MAGYRGFQIGILCVLLLLVKKSKSQSVETPTGTINGQTRAVRVSGVDYEVSRYLGIPYAEPPLGDLRFRKPQPKAKFTEPYDASDFGAACPQYEISGMKVPQKQSEDCLFLNVFVPGQTPDRDSGHAVMVFIHGGGFLLGSGDIYVADSLAAYGNVIVVTINYRLGLLGFLTSQDESAQGNFGLWDQQLSIQWVSKNIGAFGGDNKRVTIFGESAGSMSTLLQALYPQNKELFQRVIAESGTPNLEIMANRNPSDCIDYVGDVFDCDKTSTQTIISCLKEIDMAEILSTLESKGDDMESLVRLRTMPAVDNEMMHDYAKDLFDIAKGQNRDEIDFFRSIDLLIGVNSHEGGLYVEQFSGTKDIDNYTPTREEMDTVLFPTGMLMYHGKPVPGLASQLALAEYTEWSKPGDTVSMRDAYTEFVGDTWFVIPSLEAARVHANSSNNGRTYFYNFTPKPTTQLLAKAPTWLAGANHFDEIGFVFGFDKEIQANLSKMLDSYQPPSEQEMNLSYLVMRYWSNFAKTGDPNTPGSGDPVWPEYDLTTQTAFQFGSNPSDHGTVEYFKAREVNFWLNILPEVIRVVESSSRGSPFAKQPDDSCAADGDCGGH